jgi:mRNA-degrading endonuclease RelE of RelBE toxin-antitoxin system
MTWIVNVKKKAQKSFHCLPPKARIAFRILLEEIEKMGPIRGNWPHYGKLSKNRHHCHLKKGKPTYVAIWEETEKKFNLSR